MPKSPRSKPKDDQPAERKVLYPEVEVENGVIDAETAKRLLGWEAVPDGADHAFEDADKVRVRFANNVTNRPLYRGVVDTLRQEILRNHWRFNGEPIIVGRTGLILNGQHTLVSVVTAEQVRVGPEAETWKDYWAGPVEIHKLVVKGVDESDMVVNTMDTCRPRTLSDVIYRSEYFRDKDSSDREKISRMLDAAIKLLWTRTGVDSDALAMRRTHAESLDLVARHPRLVEAVRHVFTEDQGKDQRDRIARYLGPGYAAAMLYLMAASGSDLSLYLDSRKESNLDLGLWEKACEFFTLLPSSPEFRAFRELKVPYETTDEAGKRVDRHFYPLADGVFGERLSAVCRAWNLFSTGAKVTPAAMAMECGVNELKLPYLLKEESVGGIDISTAERDHDEPDEKTATAAVEAEKSAARKAKGREDPIVDERPVDVVLDEMRAKHPGRVLLFKIKQGWKVYGKDVDTLVKVGASVRHKGRADSLDHAVVFAGTDYDEAVDKLHAAGHRVSKIMEDRSVREVAIWEMPEDPAVEEPQEPAAPKGPRTKKSDKVDRLQAERLEAAEAEDAKAGKKSKAAKKAPANRRKK